MNYPILILLLLGHILGDFYFHWDSLSESKDRKWRYVFAHGGIYALCVAVILFLWAEHVWNAVFIGLGVAVAHLAIDSAKKYIKWKWFISKQFIIGQLLHIASIGL